MPLCDPNGYRLSGREPPREETDSGAISSPVRGEGVCGETSPGRSWDIGHTMGIHIPDIIISGVLLLGVVFEAQGGFSNLVDAHPD